MEIVGHTSIREQLKHIAALASLPQSFLFSGPRRLGKFLVALEFAHALSGGENPTPGQDGDLLVLGRKDLVPADETKPSTLSVADIRRVEEFLSLYPTHGKYRIVIIDEADQLTVAAENALLKILEEPNSSSIIMLVTHLPGKLLPTVRSRLFPVAFTPFKSDELRSAFPQVDLPDFFFSLGLPGLIVDGSQDQKHFEIQKDHLRNLFQLSRLSWTERLSLAEKLSSDPDHLSDTLEIWITGLERQWSGPTMRSISFAAFLDLTLDTLGRISSKEGNPRLLLEKLFTRV